MIHVDVVRVWVGGGDPLICEAGTDFEGVWAGVCQQAIVKPAATSESATEWIKGEAGANERIDFGNFDFWKGGVGLEDIERAELQSLGWVRHVVESQRGAGDAWEHPAEVAAVGDRFREVHLAGER